MISPSGSCREIQCALTRFVAECSVVLSAALVILRLITGRTPATLRALLGAHDVLILATGGGAVSMLTVVLASGLLVQERHRPLVLSFRTFLTLLPAVGMATFLLGALVHDFAGLRRTAYALFVTLPVLVFAFIIVIRPFRWEGAAAVACAMGSWFVYMALASSRPQPETLLVAVLLVFSLGFGLSALRTGPAINRICAVLATAGAAPLLPLVFRAY